MTTTPNFRALCAELVKRLDELNCNFDIPSQSALIECANDALATPPPEPPTDEELDELSWNWYSKTGSTWWQIDSYRAFARAAIERWGNH
jgi:hypothetical protein